MSEQTLRRSNWSATESVAPRYDGAAAARAEDDAFAELARIVGKGDPFAEAPRRREPVFEEPIPAPAPKPESRDDFFGVDEAAFEAALRGTIPPAAAEPFDPATAPANVVSLARHRAEPAPIAVSPAPDIVEEPVTAAVEPEPRLPDISEDPPTTVTTRTAVATPTDLGLDAAFLRELDRELFGDPPPANPVGPQSWPEGDVLAAGAPAAADASMADLEPEPAPVAPAPKAGFGGMTTVAAVLGLVVLGAGGAVGYTLLTGGARSGEPVVVRADNRPTRVAAEPSQTQQDANKIIYDRVGAQPNPAAERVVPREEQPVTQAPRVILPGGPVANLPPAAAVPEPRRVATTTIRVRPDGTLETDPPRQPPVNGPQAAAPASAPPQAAVQAPVPPAPAAPAPAPAQQQRAEAPPAPARPVQQPPQRVEAPAPQRPVAQAPVAPTRASAPPPAQATGPNAPLQLAPPPGGTRVASAAPSAPVTTGTTQATGGSGGFFVQVTSQRSDAAARQAFSDLQRRFPNILGGRTANVRSADLGERGTFYRARVGGFSREEANAFCGRLRAAGGDCVIAAN